MRRFESKVNRVGKIVRILFIAIGGGWCCKMFGCYERIHPQEERLESTFASRWRGDLRIPMDHPLMWWLILGSRSKDQFGCFWLQIDRRRWIICNWIKIYQKSLQRVPLACHLMKLGPRKEGRKKSPSRNRKSRHIHRVVKLVRKEGSNDGVEVPAMKLLLIDLHSFWEEVVSSGGRRNVIGKRAEGSA